MLGPEDLEPTPLQKQDSNNIETMKQRFEEAKKQMQTKEEEEFMMQQRPRAATCAEGPKMHNFKMHLQQRSKQKL